MSLVIYFTVSFALLAALNLIVLRIGAAMGACPQTGQIARAASVTIATGFAAIGGGAVLMIAAALPALKGGAPAVMLAMGLAALVLGLGFTHAMTLLRHAVRPPVQSAAAV